MPIRLNLLAEAQAAEDMRRRDPVKRALWIGALLTALMLVWVSSLQLRAIIANQQYSGVESRMNARTNEYKKVVEAQQKIADINYRLVSLHNLTTNRFLNATLLNALQHAVVDDIQLSQVKVDQTYALVEGTKARTNGTRITPPKPPTITEKITVTLEGSDSSAPNPGEQVARYKEALTKNSYFESLLRSSNQVSLKSLSAPQISPETGRAIVLFSLECRLPEQTR
jgi:hypothetical protein